MNINDIFYLDEHYSERAEYCNENNLMIVEIEPDENGRRFQIQEVPKIEIDELAELRHQREIECFSIINRGALWYKKLTSEQEQELAEWYQQWLDCTETKIIPKKPSWLKE